MKRRKKLLLVAMFVMACSLNIFMTAEAKTILGESKVSESSNLTETETTVQGPDKSLQQSEEYTAELLWVAPAGKYDALNDDSPKGMETLSPGEVYEVAIRLAGHDDAAMPNPNITQEFILPKKVSTSDGEGIKVNLSSETGTKATFQLDQLRATEDLVLQYCPGTSKYVDHYLERDVAQYVGFVWEEEEPILGDKIRFSESRPLAHWERTDDGNFERLIVFQLESIKLSDWQDLQRKMQLFPIISDIYNVLLSVLDSDSMVINACVDLPPWLEEFMSTHDDSQWIIYVSSQIKEANKVSLTFQLEYNNSLYASAFTEIELDETKLQGNLNLQRLQFDHMRILNGADKKFYASYYADRDGLWSSCSDYDWPEVTKTGWLELQLCFSEIGH